MTVSNSAWRKQHSKQAKADAAMAERIMNGELDDEGLAAAIGETDDVEQAVSEEARAPVPQPRAPSLCADSLLRK